LLKKLKIAVKPGDKFLVNERMEKIATAQFVSAVRAFLKALFRMDFNQ